MAYLMHETEWLRHQAIKALRLADGVSDRQTITSLRIYASECSMDADARDADVENAHRSVSDNLGQTS